MMESTPIFVIGSERSGTTLLRLMLTSHPQICIPPESLFFIHLEPQYGKLQDISDRLERFVSDLYADEKFQEWQVDRSLLMENLQKHQPLSFATAVATVYETYKEQNDPKATWWGDKNPSHINVVNKIVEYFPNSKFVHITRDVRSIYSSIKRLEKKIGKEWQGLPLNSFLIRNHWRNSINMLNKNRVRNNFYTIFYEELVSHPVETLQQVCEWLGIDYSEKMLEYHKRNAQKELVPSHRLGEKHGRTLQPILRDRVDSWKQELTHGEIEAIEILNQENLQKLGYELTTKPIRYRGWLKLLPDYIRYKQNS